MMSGMRDCHRMFLQAFMSRGILNAHEVKAYYKLACERYSEQYDVARLADFVNTINANVKPIHMEIKKGVSEDSGEHYYGLVNTSDSDITKHATDFTVNELELFKKVVEKIVCNEGTMSSTAALNLTEELDKKMTKKDAQDMLTSMARDKWINISDEGELSMSTRSIMELDQYILNQYPNVATKCNMCNRLCLVGQNCDMCDVKLHSYCAQRYFSGKDNPVCPGPSCNTPWTHAIPLSKSKDAGSSQAQAGSSGTTQTSPAETHSRKRRSRRHDT